MSDRGELYERNAASANLAARAHRSTFAGEGQRRALGAASALFPTECVGATISFDIYTLGNNVFQIETAAHKLAGLPLPTDDERVRATVRGIRRSLGAAPSKKIPATAERVIGMAPLAGTRLSAIWRAIATSLPSRAG